jgi:hypothetical protein
MFEWWRWIAFDSYMIDPSRQALSLERDRIIRRTSILTADLLAPR